MLNRLVRLRLYPKPDAGNAAVGILVFSCPAEPPLGKKSIRMTIEVNGKQLDFQSDVSLQSALAEMNLNEKQGMAVAVNQKVVPRKDWESYVLKSGDKILCINATQGG